MASIDKVDNVAKASIASINAIPAGNIQAVNKVPWVSPPQPFVMNIDTTALTAQTMQLGLTGTGTYNFDVRDVVREAVAGNNSGIFLAFPLSDICVFPIL